MILSLNTNELFHYVCSQLNTFLPDLKPIDTHLKSCLNDTLDRVTMCFNKIIIPYYKKDGQTIFNHLHTDQYSMFLYLLSNEVWNRYQDFNVASKVMYLNKILHSINCMYEVKLPEYFCFYHTVGTVIGKSAEFSNYVLICHGVTIGEQGGKGPYLGERVSLLPKSSVVGNSMIGSNSSIGIGTTIYNKDVPENSIAYIDTNGKVTIKNTEKCYNYNIFI